MIVFDGEALADLERNLEFNAQRDLIISHGGSGYIALYAYAKVQNEVRVVAIRHQREAGYRGMP